MHFRPWFVATLVIVRFNLEGYLGSYNSSCLDLVGVLHGLVLCPLLFNINISDLFLCNCESNTINYADDSTI